MSTQHMEEFGLRGGHRAYGARWPYQSNYTPTKHIIASICINTVVLIVFKIFQIFTNRIILNTVMNCVILIRHDFATYYAGMYPAMCLSSFSRT